MVVYLRAKFEVSSIILTCFRQGVILPTPPSPQNEPLKNPPRLGLNGVLFIQEIPKELILLSMDYDVALRLQNIENIKVKSNK